MFCQKEGRIIMHTQMLIWENIKKSTLTWDEIKDSNWDDIKTLTWNEFTKIEPMPISFEVESSVQYGLQINAKDMSLFSEHNKMLTYSPDMLELDHIMLIQEKQKPRIDLVARAYQPNLSITKCEAGEIKMQCNKYIPPNQLWEGMFTIIYFKALQSGTATMKLY